MSRTPDQSKSFFARPTVKGLGAAAVAIGLYAGYNKVTEPSGPVTCYETMVGEYGSTTTTQAITGTLEHEAGGAEGATFDDSSITQAARSASAALREAHTKYESVMPGDIFTVCVQEEEVNFQDGSARPSDV